MKDVDDLVDSARDMAESGFSRGEIADELNVSRETASWLVERSGAPADRNDQEAAEPARADATPGPDDIHVDWSAVGRSSARLSRVGEALADLLDASGEEVDLTVGVEKAGGPLATIVAAELETALGTYTPRKHRWEEGDLSGLGGGFSRNFSGVEGRTCYVVDDTVTSGTTLGETVEAVRDRGGEPVVCGVLADKQGLDEVAGVPVRSLLQVIRVGDE